MLRLCATYVGTFCDPGCYFVRLKPPAGVWNLGSTKTFSATQFGRNMNCRPRPGLYSLKNIDARLLIKIKIHCSYQGEDLNCFTALQHFNLLFPLIIFFFGNLKHSAVYSKFISFFWLNTSDKTKFPYILKFFIFLLSFICSANSILRLLSTLQQMKPPTITIPHLYSPFRLPTPSIFTGKGRWWWVLREVQTLKKGGVGVNGHCRGGGGEHVDG